MPDNEGHAPSGELDGTILSDFTKLMATSDDHIVNVKDHDAASAIRYMHSALMALSEAVNFFDGGEAL